MSEHCFSSQGRAPLRFLTLVLIAMLGGCSVVTQMLPSHREAQQRAERLQELQLRVMRFADEYAGRMREEFSKYQSNTTDPQERLKAQEWKVQQSNAAYTIASGSSAIINMLDMVVLATLSRMVVEDTWTNSENAARARPLREVHADLERNAWKLVEDVLSEDQKAKIGEGITRWREQHPHMASVAYIHFADFAAAAGIVRTDNPSPENLFSLFGLDVFSGLDPAVREIAQTRELAERTIFYLQRFPTLLDLQIERIAYEFAVTPEAQGLLRDTEHISRIGLASERLVTMLPELLARERAAAISQFLAEIEQRSHGLADANTELRSTLAAGTDTAHALQEMLVTLDRLTVRFQGPPHEQSAARGEPFDVREYIRLLSETRSAVHELDALAGRVDRMLPRTAYAVRTTTDGLNGVIDRAFARLSMLIVVACAAVLVAALAYRAITRKLA